MPATVTSDKQATLTIVLCLGHLGLHDTNRIVSILVMSPKVAKARTYFVAVANVFAKITSPM
jgi:hypothetical protein